MTQSRLSRKQQLIEQASAHRLQLRQAGHAVRAGLQPGALTKGAAGGLALTALAILKNRKRAPVNPPASPSAMNTAALLPIALRGLTWLTKVTARKPAVRRIIIAGVAGAVIAVIAKKAMDHTPSRRK